MKRNILFYACVLLMFGLGVYFALLFGSRSEQGRQDKEHYVSPKTTNDLSNGQDWAETIVRSAGGVLRENLREPLSILLLQLIFIVAATKSAAKLSMKLGQPAVVGEMVAGILLGPSLLGQVFPDLWSFLFQASSMGALKLLGQIGVMLFMFVVGMELNTRQLRKGAHAAVIISHASIVIPFFLGVLLSLIIYRLFDPPAVSFTSFALFMGVAMSITAFPVLARIIEERGMSRSYLGGVAIACAAVDDVTAWCILAFVIALVRASGTGALMTILMAISFVVIMLYFIRPRLDRLLGGAIENGEWEKGITIGILVFIFASACFTEIIGIHSLFGAFLAGVVMPTTPGLQDLLKNRLTAFSSIALLPIFFAFTGLRTQINLLNDWRSWLLCLGVIAVAIIGKLGGTMLAARWVGMGWASSFSIGVLMNTRGLMELIALNIGYDLGIIPERIFVIMVLMALVTTSITGPLLSIGGFMERKYSTIPPLFKPQNSV